MQNDNEIIIMQKRRKKKRKYENRTTFHTTHRRRMRQAGDFIALLFNTCDSFEFQRMARARILPFGTWTQTHGK